MSPRFGGIPNFNLPMPFLTDIAQPASVPTTVVSAQQLETAIPALSDDSECGTTMLNSLASDLTNVKTNLDPLPLGRNQLLQDMWERWATEHMPPRPETVA